GQLVVAPGRRTLGEVEAEAEFAEKTHFPRDDGPAPAGDPLARFEGGDECRECREDRRMGLALRQGELGDRASGCQCRKAQWIVEQRRGTAVELFARIASEVICKPGPPGHLQPVARLKRPPRPRTSTTMDEASMAAVRTRQKLQDRRTFSVLARGKDDSLIGPFHGSGLTYNAL